MLRQGIDTVVLGCTHYPFVIPLIEQIVGPGVRVIDPAPAVARQVERLLEERGLCQADGAAGSLEVLTTGEPSALADMLPRLLGEEVRVGRTRWRGGELEAGDKG
jgi:glutamate racemase